MARTTEQAAADLDSAVWVLMEQGIEADTIREWVENAIEDAVVD